MANGGGPHDDLSPAHTSDDEHTYYRKLYTKQLARMVSIRWRRFVYKRKRSRSALKYLTKFIRWLGLPHGTLGIISEFM